MLGYSFCIKLLLCFVRCVLRILDATFQDNSQQCTAGAKGGISLGFIVINALAHRSVSERL
jgi:hypothetical protein